MQESRPLDPVLLGRPVPVFEALAKRLAQHVTEQLQQTGHRSLALAVRDAHFTPAPHGARATTECLHIELSRHTVQAVMAQRYGFTCHASDLTDNAGTVSATEQRITHSLHDAITRAVHQILPSAASPHTPQQWQWHALLQVGDLPPQPLRIDLQTACSAALEHYVAQHRKPLRATAPSTEPLLVDLEAFLVQKTITAAEMQTLQIGSVLPINLDRAKVSLNGQIMLSASVAEHQGTLHLTAFETLE